MEFLQALSMFAGYGKQTSWCREFVFTNSTKVGAKEDLGDDLALGPSQSFPKNPMIQSVLRFREH